MKTVTEATRKRAIPKQPARSRKRNPLGATNTTAVSSLRDHAGQSVSSWMATAEVPAFSPLSKNERVNVCVVGAGIAGLTIAYLLTQAGKSVVVLDDGPILSGETERTTAHLSNALDDRYFNLERLHGEKGARLAAESHTVAIARIEQIVNHEQIDCEFERLDGYLFASPGESADILQKELEAARRAGLSEVELLPRAPLQPFDTGQVIRFPRQAQFHPIKYLAGVAQAIKRKGGRIYSYTHAVEMMNERPARVRTTNGWAVTADAIVVATNTPVNDWLVMHTKQAPYRTYVIGVEIPKESVPKALYWDTGDPYHYVRLQPFTEEKDLLIVGGEDHKTGQDENPDAHYTRLEQWTRERFPAGRVQFRWSGQVMEPVDGMAFIGRNPMDKPNVYIATGDSGQGMTHGTIAGMLITDLILGRENPWKDLYDPSRKTLRAAKDFLHENLNVAAQYADWITGGEVQEADQIALGQGAVVRQGLKKLAVYRDEQGALHTCSAVCPHLAGIVRWNAAERTWDCPCHGSRFDPFGKVLDGPSNADLAKAQQPFA